MFYSPVGIQQASGQKQLSPTKHFMKENRSVKGLTVKAEFI